jgi:hypothetical protein
MGVAVLLHELACELLKKVPQMTKCRCASEIIETDANKDKC